MAFTPAPGRLRRPSSRKAHLRVNLAGVAALAAIGVVGSLASPAAATNGAPAERQIGLTQAVGLGDSIADEVGAQANAQHTAAKVKAKKKAEEAKKAKAEEAKKEAKKKAEAKAKKERAAKAKAARAAKRAKLNAFVTPVKGSSVTTQYRAGGSMWSSGSHSGVDFAAKSGTPVRSVGSGTVAVAGWGGAYGNNIVIKHSDGNYTQYGHLSSMGVKVGQKIKSGQKIGRVGSTGNSTGPHLHFEARTTPAYGSDVNPVSYLRSKGVGL